MANTLPDPPRGWGLAQCARELTLLGKWAIFFGNYLLVNYYSISTECVGERVEVAVYGFLLLLNQGSVWVAGTRASSCGYEVFFFL